ncbi:hypothetical protein AB0H86_09085 [Streptomyces sp. NPDC050997]|uniref:hypothetical protein n=1 Tax=Streptomyces sp. NPDC050997 TaxID=3155519 RepID=UPI0034414244
MSVLATMLFLGGITLYGAMILLRCTFSRSAAARWHRRPHRHPSQRAAGDARTPGALADGFDDVFWWSAAFTAVAVPLCLLLCCRQVAGP